MIQTKKYELIGSPITHSLSPYIHKLFARQNNLLINYTAVDIKPEQFAEYLDNMSARGLSGINITAPLKQLAYCAVKNLSVRAQVVGAVNTISLQADGSLFADNTDGIGFIRDLTIRHKVPVYKQRIIILGAGGAVRGILPYLLDLMPNSIILINRDMLKAQKIALDFLALGNLNIKSYSELNNAECDLLINATSLNFNDLAGLNPELHTMRVLNYYDLNYYHDFELIKKIAEKLHARKIMSGLGMLVEQAAEAFYIWHSAYPIVEPIINKIQQNTVKY